MYKSSESSWKSLYAGEPSHLNDFYREEVRIVGKKKQDAIIKLIVKTKSQQVNEPPEASLKYIYIYINH